MINNGGALDMNGKTEAVKALTLDAGAIVSNSSVSNATLMAMATNGVSLRTKAVTVSATNLLLVVGRASEVRFDGSNNGTADIGCRFDVGPDGDNNSYTYTFNVDNGAADLDMLASGPFGKGWFVNPTLIKVGEGSLAFTGDSGWRPLTGPVTVGVGRLIVGNSTVFTNIFSLTVSNNATLAIAAGGTLNKPATLQSGATLAGAGTYQPGAAFTPGWGAHVAPGMNGIGTLTVANGLTLNGGAVLDFEFNGADNDKLVVSGGALTINGGGINLYVENGVYPWATGGTFDLIRYTGVLNGSEANLTALNAVPNRTYTFGTRTDGADNWVTLEIVNLELHGGVLIVRQAGSGDRSHEEGQRAEDDR